MFAKNMVAAKAAQKDIIDRTIRTEEKGSISDSNRQVLEKIIRDKKARVQGCYASPPSPRDLSKAFAPKSNC